jgi:hypothetical protein
MFHKPKSLVLGLTVGWEFSRLLGWVFFLCFWKKHCLSPMIWNNFGLILCTKLFGQLDKLSII